MNDVPLYNQDIPTYAHISKNTLMIRCPFKKTAVMTYRAYIQMLKMTTGVPMFNRFRVGGWMYM